jgi:hypothetical protein
MPAECVCKRLGTLRKGQQFDAGDYFGIASGVYSQRSLGAIYIAMEARKCSIVCSEVTDCLASKSFSFLLTF